jgi:hypothetical protein
MIPDPYVVDLDLLVHRLDLWHLVYSRLLSDILEGTITQHKCARKLWTLCSASHLITGLDTLACRMPKTPVFAFR